MDFPVNLKLADRPCLVVGGGAVAYRKARALARAGARVLAVAPSFDVRFGRFRTAKRAFRASDVAGACVVVAATDDPRVNRRVFNACARRRIPVNVVDVPELCTFTMPATFRRGELTVAISTNGASPALSRALRLVLEKMYPKRLAGLVRALRRARAARPRGGERRRLMRRLVKGGLGRRGRA